MEVAQLCLTLCDLVDYTFHGILQARVLEWVAFPSPEDLPNTGIKPRSPELQVDSLPAKPQGKFERKERLFALFLVVISPLKRLGWASS